MSTKPKQIAFSRFNVYSEDQHVMDFLVPEHREEDIMDDQWEIDLESAVESLVCRIGYGNVVAIFEDRISGCLDGDLRRGTMDTLVYTRESDYN